MMNKVRNAYSSWALNAQYARAAQELQNLSDRELSDLGIGRTQIWQAVREGAKKRAGIYL